MSRDSSWPRRAPATSVMLAVLTCLVLTAHATKSHEAGPLEQESAVLRSYAELVREKIGALDALREVIADAQAQADASERHRLLALGTPLPPAAAVTVNAATAAEEFVMLRPPIRLGQAARLVGFVPLQVPTTSSPTPLQVGMPPALVYAVSELDTVTLLTPAGSVVANFSAGHEGQVLSLAAASPLPEEVCALATADASGLVRLHRVHTRYQRPPQIKPDRAGPDGYDSLWKPTTVALRVFVDIHRVIHTLDDQPAGTRMTALVIATLERVPSVVVGASNGLVLVFKSSGNLRNHVQAAPAGIAVAGLRAPLARDVLFWADRLWGFADAHRSAVQRPACKGGGQGRIVALDAEAPASPSGARQALRVVVAYASGHVFAFDVDPSGRRCLTEGRDLLPDASFRAAVPDISSVGVFRGLAFSFARSSFDSGGGPIVNAAAQDLVALETKLGGAGVLWRYPARWPTAGLAVHVGNEEWRRSGLAAVLADGGREVEVLEFVLPADALAIDSETLAVFLRRLPMFGVLIICMALALHSRRAADAAGRPQDASDAPLEVSIVAGTHAADPLVCAVQTVSGTLRRRAVSALRR